MNFEVFMATKPNIEPDYEIIKKYINDGVVNIEYFKSNHPRFCKQPQYKKFIEFLSDENLQNENNLYFFGVYFFDSYDFARWQTEIEFYKILKNYNADLKDLKSFFSELESAYNNPEVKDSNRDYLRSLTIKSNNKTITVKAHPLLFDMFFQLSEWVGDQQERSQPKEKSILTYNHNFIKSTQPLFKYLREQHFKNKSDEFIYSVVANFVQSIGYNWEEKDDLVRHDYIRKSYN